jgi:putative membrane protein
MKLVLRLLISTISVYAAAQIIPGIFVKDVATAFFVAVVFGVLNTFVKPILTLLSLPITIITLGLFTLVINALLVILTAYLVPGFGVYTFLSALIFGIVVSFISAFLSMLSR